MSFFKTVKNALGIEIERPPYELIKKIGDNIEIRKYAPSKWVILILYSLFKREKKLKFIIKYHKISAKKD